MWRVSAYLADTCYSRSFVRRDCWDIVSHCTLRNAAKARNTRRRLPGSRVAASEEGRGERMMRGSRQTRGRNKKGDVVMKLGHVSAEVQKKRTDVRSGLLL